MIPKIEAEQASSHPPTSFSFPLMT